MNEKVRRLFTPARESTNIFMKNYYHDKEISDFVTGSPSLKADTALASQCVPV